MKSTKKYNFLGYGNHAQDSIPAEPLPLSGLGTLGGDASAHGVSLAGWVQPIGELLLDFDAVVERQALGVFTPLVDVRSVINKEVPHNAASIAHSARPVNPFFHNKKMFFLLDISGKVWFEKAPKSLIVNDLRIAPRAPS